MIFAPNTTLLLPETTSPFLSLVVNVKELLPEPSSSPNLDKSTVHLRGSTFAAGKWLIAAWWNISLGLDLNTKQEQNLMNV